MGWTSLQACLEQAQSPQCKCCDCTSLLQTHWGGKRETDCRTCTRISPHFVCWDFFHSVSQAGSQASKDSLPEMFAQGADTLVVSADGPEVEQKEITPEPGEGQCQQALEDMGSVCSSLCQLSTGSEGWTLGPGTHSLQRCSAIRPPGLKEPPFSVIITVNPRRPVASPGGTPRRSGGPHILEWKRWWGETLNNY